MSERMPHMNPADMNQNPWLTRFASLSLLSLLVVGGLAGCSTARTVSAPARIPVHGRIADALDSPGPGKTTLSDALSRIDRHVNLPAEALVGKPVTAFVDDADGRARKDYGLLVKFESGAKLKVEPGVTDLKQKLADGQKAASADASAPQYQQVQVAGHDALAVRSGVQYLGSGGYEIPNILAWTDSGFTYRLESDPGSVSVDALMKIAASMH